MKFLIYGEDTYRSRRKLAAARERFSATRDAGGMNTAVFRAGAATAEQAAEAIFASPFMAEKKLVVLEGFLKAGAAEQKKLVDILDRKPESTIVMLYEQVGAADLAKSPLFETLKAEKFTEEFPALTAAAAEKLVAEEAVAAGAPMDTKAARTLIMLLGTDSRLIHEEVAKLTAFALGSGKKAVTEEIVTAMVADGRDAEIFAFLDAVTEGRTRESSKMLEKLLAGGSSEIPLVAMLLKQYRAALAARDTVERGMADAAALAKALGMHPFPAGKAIAFARKHNRAALERAYEKLVQMEKAAKSGGPKAKVSLAVFVANLA
jgi:DNA polymerase-3 subunit delta